MSEQSENQPKIKTFFFILYLRETIKTKTKKRRMENLVFVVFVNCESSKGFGFGAVLRSMGIAETSEGGHRRVIVFGAVSKRSSKREEGKEEEEEEKDGER